MINVQRAAYVDGLGDNWFKRNKKDLGKAKSDPPQILLRNINHDSIKNLLEVGCSNAWRPKLLRERYGWNVYGIDPSEEAIKDARASIDVPADQFVIGTADALPWPRQSMDCVIMGYCMWAMAPEDWLSAVSESDRVLRDGGLLIIYDRFTPRPIRRLYPERSDVYGFAYDWKKLWLAHPGYQEITECLGIFGGLTVEGATMLHKGLYRTMLTVQEPEE